MNLTTKWQCNQSLKVGYMKLGSKENVSNDWCHEIQDYFYDIQIIQQPSLNILRRVNIFLVMSLSYRKRLKNILLDAKVRCCLFIALPKFWYAY